MTQVIHSATSDYAVQRLVGRTPVYNVYTAVQESTGYECLLKIAASVGENGLLDREALILREIHGVVTRIEAEHQRNEGAGKNLGYEYCFPRLQESFLVPEQGNRRVNIVSVHGVREIADLVPLEQWRTRQRVRIDPKSSAWIMGRLLKIFTLTHSLGVAAGKINGGNILINPNEHHVMLFDWTGAQHEGGLLSPEVAGEEISQAARAVFTALGGDLETGTLPTHEQLPDSRYVEFLKQLVDKQTSDSFSAMARLYRLLDEMWERSFHPFTTIPL